MKIIWWCHRKSEYGYVIRAKCGRAEAGKVVSNQLWRNIVDKRAFLENTIKSMKSVLSQEIARNERH